MKPPARLTVLTAALLVLLPAIAALQYRWVGQLRDAERDRMQRNLHTAARQFQESFDSEVARAFLHLQVDSAIARDQAWHRYAERYAAWASMTAYPGLVAGVYLVDAPEGEVRLRRWDAQARTFALAEWTAPIAAQRERLAADLAAARTGRPVREPIMRGADDGLLIAPLLNVHFGPPGDADAYRPAPAGLGYTVLQLNLPLIAGDLLPALTRRHFSHADGDGFTVAVVDARDSRRVIYQSAAPIDPARADVNVPFFGAHRDPLMVFARSSGGGDTRNVLVSVIRERREGEVTVRARASDGDSGRWRLLAQHERGSLDAAVAGVRQRNLLVSFGVLLLMGITIGLLALSSRRAHRLALQQMEFVAGVSHELRTPVAVIRSAAENLSHGVVGDPERVRRYGDAIQLEARRLGEMVERVLQLAGIASGRRLARLPVALAPLIEEAIESARPAGAADVVVERRIAGDLPAVAGEAAALRSAIENLLANAFKYGGADRWVGVRADASPDRREVRVTVEDHGRGIPAGDLPHVFDPFYRGADAAARQIQGSGLGLALVRRIAEAHGGRVSVVTREGAGTAFTLHLPAAAGVTAADAAAYGDVKPMAPMTR